MEKTYAIKVAGGYVGLDWPRVAVDASRTAQCLADAALFTGPDELGEAFELAARADMATRSPVVVEVLVTYAEGEVVPDPETDADSGGDWSVE